ncbi:MAG: DUF4252 domain-containing protein [Candidatus Kapaibacterium sp.]
MKKIIVIALAVVMTAATALAQDSPYISLFDKYTGKKGFTTVLINKEMFETMGEMMKSDSTNGAVNEMLSGINAMLVLTYKFDKELKREKSLAREVYKDFLSKVPMSEYKSLVLVNDEGSNVRILAKQTQKEIKELLVLVGEENEATLVNISGAMSLDKISKLSEIMQIKELQQLQQMDQPNKGK